MQPVYQLLLGASPAKMSSQLSVILVGFLALTTVTTAQTYDYVIAGGGTAGLLLAVVLTEDPNVTVAVLEAGGDGRQDQRITVPEKEGSIVGSEYDWQLTTVPQQSMYNKPMQPVNRGKVLGGTSAMNYMIWNRASRVEYDAWESILGNTGWNWDSLSAASKASEHFFAPTSSVPAATYDLSYHGMSGPVHSTMQRNTFSLYTDYLIPTLKILKVPIPIDRDGGNITGAGPVPLSIDRDSYTRSYSAAAYAAVQDRSNLNVITEATVARIAWGAEAADGSKVARGLRYRNTSSSSSASTLILGRQVILSAGSIQTPQILEISGIGDPKILSPIGINTKVNLPAAGTGLQDKITYSGSFSFSINNFTGTKYVQTFLDYAPASRLLSAADLATFRQLLNGAKAGPTMSQAAISILKRMVETDQPLVEIGWFQAFTNVYLLHPLSCGTVHINTTNPTTSPVIDPGYNSAVINGTSIDLWLLSKAISYMTTTLAKAAPFSDINAKFSVDSSLSQSAIQNKVFQGLGIGQHWTGGAVMLPQADGGVVDQNLLVYGTNNVRVVDSFVIPAVPGQHPMGLAYAIAMRAASILSQS